MFSFSILKISGLSYITFSIDNIFIPIYATHFSS